MAYIPTLRTLANMRAREIPGYFTNNLGLSGLTGFFREVKDWYYERYLVPGRIAPLFHFMVISSSIQYFAVLPWHKTKHAQGLH